MTVELQRFADFVVVVALQAGVGQIEADKVLRAERKWIFRYEVPWFGEYRGAVREPKSVEYDGYDGQ